MRVPVSLLALLALSLPVAAARADTMTFDFTISGSGYSGSGVLTGTSDPSNPLAFDLTSGSGTLNGIAIMLNYVPGVDIANPGTDMAAGAMFDNVLYPSGAEVLDSYGLDFAYGSNVVVPYYSGGYMLYDTSQPFFADNSAITFSATEVPAAITPEPASLVLVGTGALSFLGMARRKLIKA